MYKSFLTITLVILLMVAGLLAVNLFSRSFLEREAKKDRGVSQRNSNQLPLRLFIAISFVFLTIYHIYRYPVNSGEWYYPIIVYSFIWNSFLLLSSVSYKPYVLETEEEDYQAKLAKLKSFRSVVVIPAYNEDAVTFQQMLESLVDQELTPTDVCIVEDGSQEENKLEEIVAQWQGKVPFRLSYRYVENGGKRVAQSYVFKEMMEEADVFLTMDSDTVLDRRAVLESLIPFLNEEVMSVAGLLLAKNTKKLLSKILSVSFAASFTNGRASASRFDAVAVSCGGLATYRSIVIKKYLHHYLNQIVFGSKAKFGDDRMLTHYASLLGRTVYQETAIGYTLMPENISHLSRQRVRWWKSFWWGGMFLTAHHSPRYPIWWLIAAQYVTQVLYAVVFPILMIIHPLQNGEPPWYILAYMIVLGYIRCIRVLDISDSKGKTYLSIGKYLILTPLSTVLNIYIGTILAYYGFFMMWQVTGWGTREKIEVSSEEDRGTLSGEIES